jgi:uncharacterized membrane protein
VRSSLWIIPVFALIAEVLMKRLAETLGGWMVREGFYDLQTGFYAVSATEAHAILDRIFTLNLSCLVFTFGSLLVAIQVAGGQYTPRIIATTLLRDNVIRWIVGLFVFSLVWSHRTMAQLGQGNDVPQFEVFLASMIAFASLIAFIVLIDYSAKLLRPVSLVMRVAEQGFTVIENIYPNVVTNEPAEAAHGGKQRGGVQQSGPTCKTIESMPPALPLGAPDRVIYHEGDSGVVLAVNLRELLAEAERARCVIELGAQVGDFIAVDEPLFYLYGKVDTVHEQRLRHFVALGSERTMEQDPMFSFRIEVDIALKALSPAINDPTTAVLAIDQLHRLLRMVGKRSLLDNEIRDRDGRLRVLFHTPNWEDFVYISFREIRQCSAGSLQIERRLRAMLENLLKTLPQHCHRALSAELELLDREVMRRHAYKEDAELARIPDTQGLGGSSGAQAPNWGR